VSASAPRPRGRAIRSAAGPGGRASGSAAGPDEGQPGREPGHLYAGTSGFAFPGWAPRFYAPGSPNRRLLAEYAARLPAVELHNTFYRRPDAATIEGWLRDSPPSFRFCPKAQRGAAFRAWHGDADQVAESLRWLNSALSVFGPRLGAVLLSAPSRVQRDDAALARLLEARPDGLPLALELPHPSWAADEVHALLRDHDVALVAADHDGPDEPDLRRIGPFLYLRLRRTSYDDDGIARWAERLVPFLADGVDAYAFFRHDADGRSALDAEALSSRARHLLADLREAGGHA
jgi:uncharacterized protein YecE (DUF72 family)